MLENSSEDDTDDLGFTFPYPNNAYFSVYYPHRVDYIYIYTLEIDGEYTGSDRNKVRQSVIGHEIGHAINLDHCQGVHSSCIMRVGPDAPPTTRGDRYDSDHAVNLRGYKIR